MKNNRGIVDPFTLLAIVAVIGALLYIPNPISSSLGVGIRPNKTVEKQVSRERVELLKDKDGNIIATKTYTDESASDKDIQQRVSLWEQLRSIPVLFMVLAGLGVFFPFIGARLFALYKGAKKEILSYRTESKKIVTSLDDAFATIAMTLAGENLPGEINRAALAKKIKDNMLDVLSKKYDQSTKDLVRELRA